jgi:septum formation protein
MTQRLVLASTSPRRRQLLEQIGLLFDVVAPDFEEDMSLPLSIDDLAVHLATGKARSVADEHPDAVVIGGDTFVEIGGQLLGKPASPEHAVSMLQRLSNRAHHVHTGFAVIRNDRVAAGVVTSSVHMGAITPSEAAAYVSTGEPLDKAGAYTVNGLGALFVDRIEGDFSAIVGLPLAPVARVLRTYGIAIV